MLCNHICMFISHDCTSPNTHLSLAKTFFWFANLFVNATKISNMNVALAHNQPKVISHESPMAEPESRHHQRSRACKSKSNAISLSR